MDFHQRGTELGPSAVEEVLEASTPEGPGGAVHGAPEGRGPEKAENRRAFGELGLDQGVWSTSMIGQRNRSEKIWRSYSFATPQECFPDA